MAETTLRTPIEVHGVRTVEEYLAQQRKYIARKRVARPNSGVRDPFVSTDRPPVFVGSGKWLVRCVCGNAPVVDPAWALAACFECGAIYEQLQVPTDAAEIAQALLRRPNRADRAWVPPETAADLHDQNIVMGVAPVGEEP